jgi:transposase
MAKPLDTDLRVRVVGAVRTEGMSRHASAARFGVSAASAIRWCQLEEETGSVEPRPMGGAHPSKLLDHRDFLLALVKAEPDLTITEIRGRLAKRGVSAGHATVWRFYDREKISFKKNTARRRAGSAGRRAGPARAARKAA